MATVPYMTRTVTQASDAASVYPIVLYARSIKKNTAEFTGSDLRKYLRWLWKVYPTLGLERKWDHGRTWHRLAETPTRRHQATGTCVQSANANHRPRMPIKDRPRRSIQYSLRGRATSSE